ncbi:carbohydrate kinase [Caldichromatium japonicum]|uniref:Carbohydrate kinase n=1 Tax=Caldichromatium japonicum TaxID=2699430 RepID=A0A6G7VEX5_9GAMM|nr:PfkB family carbohydrate kinase [Caldichromatium japonicum]QIK38633.1 carbohydrate kinase [Caldichromatium japonicum]
MAYLSSDIEIFGEVLFDHFPDGQRVLGGAPLNVAWHLAGFGLRPRLISAVGSDLEGELIRAEMSAWGLDTSCLQTDAERPTGAVQVSLEAGEPSYHILPERAYDYIRPPMDIRPGALLYHGTLALRSPISAQTLKLLRRNAGLVFCDVNMRNPWWSLPEAHILLDGAHWVKLNRDELRALAEDLDLPLAEQSMRLLARYRLSGLIVTLGPEGALGLTAETGPVFLSPPSVANLTDTVGAGDAFAAVALLGLIQGWPLEWLIERAQSFAAQIITQRGAVSRDRALYERLVSTWGLKGQTPGGRVRNAHPAS